MHWIDISFSAANACMFVHRVHTLCKLKRIKARWKSKMLPIFCSISLQLKSAYCTVLYFFICTFLHIRMNLQNPWASIYFLSHCILSPIGLGSYMHFISNIMRISFNPTSFQFQLVFFKLTSFNSSLLLADQYYPFPYPRNFIPITFFSRPGLQNLLL
jgi:hypothetical protein